MIDEALDEATDRAAFIVPECQEAEALNLVHERKSSRVHDLLIRATVREGIAMLQLQKARGG